MKCGAALPVAPESTFCAECSPTDGRPRRTSARYGELFDRLAAAFLDALVVGVPVFVILLITVHDGPWTVAAAAASPVLDGLTSPGTLLTVAVGVTYHTAFVASPRQATLGKMVAGLKVGDERGHRLSTAKAFLRAVTRLMYALPWIGLPLALVTLFLVHKGPRRQALHDHACGSLVWREDALVEAQEASEATPAS